MRLTSIWKWLALALAVAIAGPSILDRMDMEEVGGRAQRHSPASASAIDHGDATRAAMPVCTHGRHPPASGSCVIDGDSGWLDGVQWRLEGIDAPEVGKPECAAERETGERAKRRLADLLSGGFTVERGRDDRYGRQLVRFRLASGDDAGEVLMRERLAQVWPNQGNVWCDH